jgi:hypothetical protein
MGKARRRCELSSQLGGLTAKDSLQSRKILYEKRIEKLKRITRKHLRRNRLVIGGPFSGNKD